MSQSSPDINGISPRSGPPGTSVAIRGTYLGSSQSSIVALYICGFDCTLWAEWKSSKKIVAISGQTRLGSGQIVLVLLNERGEKVKCNCLVEFTVEALSVGLCEEWAVWPESDRSLFETQELKPAGGAGSSAAVDPRRDRSASESATSVNAAVGPGGAGDPTADLLSANFDPVKFLLAQYRSKSAADLQREVRNLRTSVNADPAQAVGFLKPHLNDVFKGLDELDSLRRLAEQERSQLLANSTDTQRLLRDCNRIAGELFQAALNRKDHTDTLRNAIHVMEKSRGLFNLPGVLDAHMRADNHKLAIDEYLRGKARYGSTRVPTFQRVWEQVESRATVLRKKLLNRLMPPAPLHESTDTDSSSAKSWEQQQQQPGLDGPLSVEQHTYLVRQLQRLGVARAADDSLAYLRQRYLAAWWRRHRLGEFLRHYSRLLAELGVSNSSASSDESVSPLGQLAIDWVHLQQTRLGIADKNNMSDEADNRDNDGEKDYGDAGAECRLMRENLAGVSAAFVGASAGSQLTSFTSRLRLRYLSQLRSQYIKEVAGLRANDDWAASADGGGGGGGSGVGAHSQLPLVYEKLVNDFLTLLAECLQPANEIELTFEVIRSRWGQQIRDAVAALMSSFCDRLRQQLPAVASGTTVSASSSGVALSSAAQQQPQPQQCSRLLAVHCDASFACRHPNRRILASLRAEGHSDLESVAAKVEAYYGAFLDELKAAYVEEKARAIYGPLEAKMLRAGFTWARCAPPAAPRLYVRDALHSVGEVLAEIGALGAGSSPSALDDAQKPEAEQNLSALIGSKAYAEDVLKQVVCLLVQELHRCFMSVPAWCHNGRLQAYLDVRVLDDLLGPYLSYESRTQLRSIYSAINSESGRTVLSLTADETQFVDRIVRQERQFLSAALGK